MALGGHWETLRHASVSSALFGGQNGPREIDVWSLLGLPRGPFFKFFSAQKKVKKWIVQNLTFFSNFGRFGGARRRFSTILAPKMDPQSINFQPFSENAKSAESMVLSSLFEVSGLKKRSQN